MRWMVDNYHGVFDCLNVAESGNYWVTYVLSGPNISGIFAVLNWPNSIRSYKKSLIFLPLTGCKWQTTIERKLQQVFTKWCSVMRLWSFPDAQGAPWHPRLMHKALSLVSLSDSRPCYFCEVLGAKYLWCLSKIRPKKQLQENVGDVRLSLDTKPAVGGWIWQMTWWSSLSNRRQTPLETTQSWPLALSFSIPRRSMSSAQCVLYWRRQLCIGPSLPGMKGYLMCLDEMRGASSISDKPGIRMGCYRYQ